MLTTSVIAGVGKTLRAQVLTAAGARPPKGRVFPKRKWKLVVMAVAMGVLFAFLALIAASQTPKVGHYSSPVSSNSQWQTEEVAVSQPGAAPQVSKKEALDAYTKLPLSFVPNEGQTDKAVRYYSQGAGYGFYFTKGGAMLSFSDGEGGGHALALSFLGANPHATLDAQKRLSGQVNYLQGNDPTKWQQGLATHAELLYGGLWPGIDMAVRGEGGKLKYEFHLKRGSSIEDVRLGYRGVGGLKVGAGGELLIQTSQGVLRDAAPVSYQRIGGERVPVKSHYKLTGDGTYRFAVGAHDPRYPLVIDPGLDYSTFLGGADFDFSRNSIAVDRSGRVYVTGFTTSTDYPTTPGAFDRTLGGNNNAFVSKLNAAGSALEYSTFLGGDTGDGIAVREGRAYVTGTTTSA